MIKCDYCEGPARYVSGKLLYPESERLHASKFYHCDSCKAYVGVHKGTNIPLGRLANEDLRNWKTKAHTALDVLNQDGSMSRGGIYAKLAKELNIPVSEYHIANFDIKACKKFIKLCKKRNDNGA